MNKPATLSHVAGWQRGGRILMGLALVAALGGGSAGTAWGKGGDEKVTICHRLPDKPTKYETLMVDQRAVAGHLGHGDALGPCADACVAGLLCNDNNACTTDGGTWTMMRGKQGSCACTNTAKVCSASDPCHVAGTCNTATGVCTNPAAADGTACNDGDNCTQTDTCQAGTCTGSNAVVCVASDQCHTAGTCETGTGVCSNPAKPDGTTCDAGTDSGSAKTCEAATCNPCALQTSPSPRFVDNGNGTITDRLTCLVWEKKDGGIGTVVICSPPSVCSNLHNVNNRYNWSDAVTAFPAALNAGAGFAGHHDWRMPSEDGRNSPFTGPKELETILRAAYPCDGFTNPCTWPEFKTGCVAGCSATGATPCSCTQSYLYWSATTFAGNPSNAWDVVFDNGNVLSNDKTFNFYVRAVRGGL